MNAALLASECDCLVKPIPHAFDTAPARFVLVQGVFHAVTSIQYSSEKRSTKLMRNLPCTLASVLMSRRSAGKLFSSAGKLCGSR